MDEAQGGGIGRGRRVREYRRVEGWRDEIDPVYVLAIISMR